MDETVRIKYFKVPPTFLDSNDKEKKISFVHGVFWGALITACLGFYLNARNRQELEEPKIAPAPQTSVGRIREKQQAQPAPVQPVAESPIDYDFARRYLEEQARSVQADREFARRYLEEQARLGTGL